MEIIKGTYIVIRLSKFPVFEEQRFSINPFEDLWCEKDGILFWK